MNKLNTVKQQKMFEIGKILIGKNLFSKEFQISQEEVLFFAKKLEKYGYSLSQNTIKKLQYLEVGEFIKITALITTLVLKSRGANFEYNILMKNFEDLFISGTDEEIALNAVSIRILNTLDYLSKGKITIKERIQAAFDSGKVVARKINLDLMNEDEYLSFINSKISMRTNFSLADKELMEYYFKYEYKMGELEFGNNENMIFAYNILYENNPNFNPKFKTFTNAIRFIKSYYKDTNDYDFQNYNRVKLRKLTAKDRKRILTILNSFRVDENIILDAKMQVNFFKNLNRVLHALSNENKKRYPNAYEILNTVFNEPNKYQTIYSKIEEYVSNKDDNIFSFLEDFPGIFIKMAGRLYKIFDSDKVINLFEKLIPEFELEQVLSLKKYFENILRENRVFIFNGKAFIKDNDNLEYTIEDVKLWLDKINEALAVLLKHEHEDEKVFIVSNFFDKIVTPTDNKGLTDLSVLTTGSRVSLPFSNDFQMFCHWDHGQGDVDVDASVIFYDENFNYVSSIAYHEMQNRYGIHSGDVRLKSQGDSEFITIYKDKLDDKVSYISLNINLYYADYVKTFKELNETIVGIGIDMKNKFNPQRVVFSTNFKVDTMQAVPFIYDIKKEELIFANFQESAYHQFWSMTAANNKTKMQALLAGIMQKKTGIKNLLKIYTTVNNFKMLNLDEGIEYAKALDENKKEDIVLISSVNENTKFDIDIFENSLKFNEYQISEIIYELKIGGFSKKTEKEIKEKENEVTSNTVKVDFLKELLKEVIDE
ncbi:MAG: hypothetical protein GX931_04855 [Acholeplasmataceae bacterium]|nr:hypothetical protein [Acholeplasmataceae bacterium]